MPFPGNWGGVAPWLRGPPGLPGLPAGQGRDWGARWGGWPERASGLGPAPEAGKAGDAVPRGLSLGTR